MNRQLLSLSLLGLLIGLALTPLAWAATGGTFDLSWWTADDGGGSSSGGTYTVSGTVGQPDAGVTLASGTYTVSGGFWGGAGPSGNTIPLTAGWNLISFNVTPSAGNAITDVLAPIMSDLIVAQGFDGGGLSYYPGGAQNTLHTMDATHGYWLKVSTATTLSISGTTVVTSSTPIALTAGWNLIGYLSGTAKPLGTALFSIDGLYTAVLSFEQGAESWYAVLPDSMNTLTTMYPHHGYWIYMTQAATLTYP